MEFARVAEIFESQLVDFIGAENNSVNCPNSFNEPIGSQEEKWIPLPNGWIKINFYAAIKDFGLALSFVVRDSRGNIIWMA